MPRPKEPPRRRVERHELTATAAGNIDLLEGFVTVRASAHAQVDHRDEQLALGVGHRSQDTTEEARADGDPSKRREAFVVSVDADMGLPDSLVRAAIPSYYEPCLASAEDNGGCSYRGRAGEGGTIRMLPGTAPG